MGEERDYIPIATMFYLHLFHLPIIIFRDIIDWWAKTTAATHQGRPLPVTADVVPVTKRLSTP